ncbi:MAG: hypothetical protein QNJ71_02025 [Acidimicrobiia bacterium]|nr:hypothetical protein [Acidimicrobiia bacterium]
MAPQILRNVLPALIITVLAGSSALPNNGDSPTADDTSFAAPLTFPIAPPRAIEPLSISPTGISQARTSHARAGGSAVTEPLSEAGIEIRGADGDRRQQIERALGRFDEAGLELPSLIIQVHDSRSCCDGNGGLFRWGGEVAQVELCAPETFVILHELGHAWELTHMTDDERNAFLEAADLTEWDDRSIPWKERGREVAANIIAIGLAYRELSGMDLRQFAAELELYEVLTGLPSPRIAE